MGKTLKNDSDLYTQTCPYRLARLGTSLRVRGKLTLRKKAIKFYKSINWSNEYTKNRIGNVSCPRLSGKVSTDRLTKGASVSRNEKSGFYRAVLNTCLSFLNGRKKRSGIQE